jgi:cytoskeletal protein RodZ
MFEIGPALRQARERRRLGLDQAEAETKVRARYLRALEDEEFDLIPGPAYVKGFLRTYADYLDLDGRLFVEEYNCRFVDPRLEDELLFPRTRAMPPRPRRRAKREADLILVVLAAIVALTVIVAIGWTYADDPRPPAAAFVPVPTTTERTSSLVDPRIEGARDTQAQSQRAAKAAAPRKPVRLLARTTAPCWVTVWRGRDQSAEAVYVGTLDPSGPNGGTTKVLQSRTGFTVQIGNAGALELVVNGRPQSLGSRNLLFWVAPDGTVTPA